MENLLFNMQAHQFVATIRGVLASETSDLQPLAVVIEDAEQEEIDDIAALQADQAELNGEISKQARDHTFRLK